jgi:hypothetical protein
VAQAVEAGQVPADLLTELQTEIEDSKDLSKEEGHVRAVRDMAERLGIPVDQVDQGLSALESHPAVTRELLMRRIAEAWLETQRKAYRSSREA